MKRFTYLSVTLIVMVLSYNPKHQQPISILPPEGWKTEGDVTLKENGRIYVTDGQEGFAYRNCSVNMNDYPYLMVRMNDSYPGGLWSIFIQKENQKIVLLETKEEGEFLLPWHELTGWQGEIDFIIGIGLKGRKGDWIVFDYLQMVKFDDGMPGIPKPRAPTANIILRPFAVQFLWKQVRNAVGYELHYSQFEDFNQNYATKIVSPFITDELWYLPEMELEKGNWFWRVRAINMNGQVGDWSETDNFRVSEDFQPATPERIISTNRPLLVLFSDFATMRENWLSLPDVIRRHAYLRIEILPTEKIEKICAIAETNKIPILIQVSGPHDYYGNTSSRVSLSEVERFYQEFSMLKGVFICEQACQYDGLKNKNVWRYIDRLLRLSAYYRKMLIWADGHWGRYLWLDLVSNEKLFSTVQSYRDYFAPVWKMNCGLTPYSVHGSLLALWLSGSVNNWGVEPENWYWFEAGFGEQNEQKWFKEGAPEKMPPSFYGQMLMLGIVSGASVYVIEPPSAIWEKPGLLAPNWQNNLYPLMEKLVENEIIPGRETVWSLVKYAVAFDKEIVWQGDYGNDLKEFYQQVYEPHSQFDVLPKTNNYFVPIFLAQTQKGSLDKISTNFRMRKNGSRTVFIKTDSEEKGFSGTALIVKNDDTYFVMNDRENYSSNQDYNIKLAGNFSSLRGTLKTNEYLIAQQSAFANLKILLNLRPGQFPSSLQITFTPQMTSQPRVSLIAGTYKINTDWDRNGKVLRILFDGIVEGSFEILIAMG